MTNCLCFGHSNHVQLIKNCYPVKEGGTIPHSSQLSYLTFYASSKPAKLAKVGSYLDKKVTKDIRKGRKDYNHVSLLIVKKLIQTCHRDLNIFSKYIISILSKLLDTRDLDLIDLTCSTFIVFSLYHDGSNLGVDADFTAQYEELLQKFSQFCNYGNTDDTLSLQMKYTGHRAIQAAISSPALESSEFKTQLHILFAPLIAALANSSKPLNNSEKDIRTDIDITVSALNNTGLSMSDIEQLASETVSILFNKLKGPSVRVALVPLFEYMNKHDKWWPPNLSVDIMKLILSSLQPQYRYLLVSDILYHLDLLKVEETDAKYAALTKILSDILNAKISLLGISVLEVLNSLFTLTIKSIQHHTSSSPHEIPNGEYYDVVQDSLIRSMGGLASQSYYDNQLNDMFGYLISKLRANTSLETVDNIPLHEYRLVVLKCLDSVINGTKHSIISNSSEFEIQSEGHRIFLDTWNPALHLLCDKNQETRLAFCISLDDFLSNMMSSIDISNMNQYPQHAFVKHRHDALFVEGLLQVMYNWVLISDFNKTDLQYLYSFLCLLNRKFGVDALLALIPFMFKLQQLIQKDIIKIASRQSAIAFAAIKWFMFVAQMYKIPTLYNYMEQIEHERASRCQTEDIEFSETIQPNSPLFQPFEDDVDMKPITTWIERGEIVEIISKEGKMRDQEDIHGLELEAKLFTEWGTKSTTKSTNNKNYIALQKPEKVKPRLSNPWNNHILENETLPLDKKESIRVENLKEALVAPVVLGEEEKDDSRSSRSNSVGNTSSYRPRKDMNALLNELNTSKHDQSTISLVNPPYKL